MALSGRRGPHVLVAMFGEDSPRIHESLRLSLGMTNTSDDIDQLVAALKKIIPQMKVEAARKVD